MMKNSAQPTIFRECATSLNMREKPRSQDHYSFAGQLLNFSAGVEPLSVSAQGV
jgi:hypothetical protein